MTVCRAASIVIDNDHLEYFGPEGAHWRAPVSRIRALGELRVRGLEDSHYLAVLIDESGAWLQAPIRANGMQQTLEALGARLNHPLRLSLSARAIDTSRTLWPAHLEGEPLFEFRPDARLSVTARVQEHLATG